MGHADAIRTYFHAWLKKDATELAELFAEDAIYSECYGPEYHGIAQILRWFEEWNRRGTVIRWEMKRCVAQADLLAVEWYFQCEYDQCIDGFDGVSLVRFNAQDKIVEVKEFQSKAEHVCPYEV